MKVNPTLAGLAIVGLTFGVAFGSGPLIGQFTGDDEGDYAFMLTQPHDPDAPVTYPPCRPIEVAINPDGAPDDYERLVTTAMDHISRWSGLELVLVEETDEPLLSPRPTSDAARYGPGPSPVLVVWADDDDVPGLAGDVVGLGGSTPMLRDGVLVYVTGEIALDREAFDDMEGWRGDRKEAQAIVDHEFAHVIGLGHVQDSGELMNKANYGRKAFGPGDREGLALLGKGRCIPLSPSAP